MSAVHERGGLPADAAPARAWHALEYWLLRYRKIWRGTAATTLLSPVLYLAAMGLGLGALVDERGGDALGGVGYLQFIAPGLLAAAAMQNAVVDSTWPVANAVRWDRTYVAMGATPLRPQDILLGHLGFIGLRLVATLGAFLLVATAFGALDSPWAILAWPAAVLCGLAFATPVIAFAVGRDDEGSFAALQRFAVVPMFLFSGTFFPVSQLPAALEPLAWATPLWHGVSVCRDLALGEAGLGTSAGHVSYLLLWVVGGLFLAMRAYDRRLGR